jgi:site-specific DNA-methyltransferase (cytosine-N4-specific)
MSARGDTVSKVYDDGFAALYHGDVLARLGEMADGSAQMCVTSPPYWGLRDYGTATWAGGDMECDHMELATGMSDKNTLGRPEQGGMTPANAANVGKQRQYRDACGKCGARRIDDQLGLEATPAAYVSRMVAVFREVRRVLRDDGTLWLNLGDSYASRTDGSDGGWDGNNKVAGVARIRRQANDGNGHRLHPGTKPKDLVGIPWRVALALQADGWTLRADIIWSKPNPMPESVTDRPTKAHEYLFLLTKRERYYYDADAIREPHAPASVTRYANGGSGAAGKPYGMQQSPRGNDDGRNKRSVWTIATESYAEAHFATFPTKLVEPCILAGCPEGGVVLEPFAGSGTALAVAKALGRRSVGIELNAEYCRLAARRIQAVTLPMFAGAK